MGLDARAAAVRLERLAVNLADARIPDNAGAQPHDEPLDPSGAAALWTTLPVRAAEAAIREAGLPVEVSYTAGTYVCNATFYRVLAATSGLPTAAKVAAAALALRPARKASPALAQAIFDSQQVALIDLAKSHADLIRWEAFTEALGKITDPDTRTIMARVRDLFGLSVIERDLAWFLLEGRLSVQRGKAVTTTIDSLLRRLRPHALDLVDAWGYGPELLRAPIASGQERERQDEARAYYAQARADGTMPKSEKSLKKKAARA